MSRTRLPERPVGPLATPARRKKATSTLLALTTMLTPVLVNVTAAPASASSVSSAVFSGGAGSVSVDGRSTPSRVLP